MKCLRDTLPHIFDALFRGCNFVPPSSPLAPSCSRSAIDDSAGITPAATRPTTHWADFVPPSAVFPGLGHIIDTPPGGVPRVHQNSVPPKFGFLVFWFFELWICPLGNFGFFGFLCFLDFWNFGFLDFWNFGFLDFWNFGAWAQGPCRHVPQVLPGPSSFQDQKTLKVRGGPTT